MTSNNRFWIGYTHDVEILEQKNLIKEQNLVHNAQQTKVNYIVLQFIPLICIEKDDILDIFMTL